MKYLVCNLKANKTKDELKSYEKEISKILTIPTIELIICPSLPFLYLFQSPNYSLGSQDVSMFEEGSYTGETTANQLQSINVKYALVGHSERRKLLLENNKMIISKIKKSYHSHIKPIYFIGETEKDKLKINKRLKKQLLTIIDEVPDYKRTKMIIVYEPRWAIGTGIIPSNEEITIRIKEIKSIIKEKYNLELPVLYGGSVNEDNIDELVKIDELDGFVLGESSKKSSEVEYIYQKIQKNI